MGQLTTDVGTLELLKSLTPEGRSRLDAFLERCRRHGGANERLHGRLFTRSDIVEMTLERDWNATDDKVLATTDFHSGARWRRGSLRMPGVTLPEVVMTATKGRLIEELVSGAPLNGYRISHAVFDGKPTSPGGRKLRIRCDGERQAPFP